MDSALRKIVLAVVVRDSTVLMIERRKKEKSGDGSTLSWTFPGGKIENGETTFEAVAREVLEETGYSVNPKSVIDERQHDSFPVLVSYIACEIDELSESAETKDPEVINIKWIKIQDIENYITSSLNEKVRNYLSL
jgi:mutator protein MutT